MPEQTLNCPSCGAPVSPDAASCDHCGAHLATVSCPACFGLMFAGSQFCPHCGAKADRAESSGPTSQLCPSCRAPMNAVVLGAISLQSCPACLGDWVDGETLRQICSDQEKQSAVLGVATSTAPASRPVPTRIHYLPCPVCHQLMNRVNFASCSGVIVEVCAKHGTWFEPDGLRQAIEFIRGGGLEKARAREIAELEEKRRRLALGELNTDRPVNEDSSFF